MECRICSITTLVKNKKTSVTANYVAMDSVYFLSLQEIPKVQCLMSKAPMPFYQSVDYHFFRIFRNCHPISVKPLNKGLQMLFSTHCWQTMAGLAFSTCVITAFIAPLKKTLRIAKFRGKRHIQDRITEKVINKYMTWWHMNGWAWSIFTCQTLPAMHTYQQAGLMSRAVLTSEKKKKHKSIRKCVVLGTISADIMLPICCHKRITIFPFVWQWHEITQHCTIKGTKYFQARRKHQLQSSLHKRRNKANDLKVCAVAKSKDGYKLTVTTHVMALQPYQL